MSEEPDQKPPPGISTGLAVVFYGIMVAVAWVLGVVWLELDLLVWHEGWWDTALWIDALLGIGLGVATVFVSRVLEKTTEWARVLSEEFKKILGDLSPPQVLVFAVTSGIAEEVFFRGFLQQALSDVLFTNHWIGLVVASLIFGLIHVGPDRKKFLPWTIMAVVLGFFFGLLYMYTGNIVGPVVAHFTINFFNLLHIAGDSASSNDSEAPSTAEADPDDREDPWNH